MKTVLDHGIILRVRPYRDTSVMVHWMTAENGRITTAVRGARGPKSAFRGKLDLFIEADLSLRWRDGAEVQTLGEVLVTEHHAALRLEVASLAILAHAVATLEQVTEPSTPQFEAYQELLGLVRHLERHGPRPRALFAWELRFLALQGLAPSPEELFGNSGPETEGLMELMESITASDWEAISALRTDAATAQRLDRGLQRAWSGNFGRLPKTRAQALGLLGMGFRSPSLPPMTRESDGSSRST